MWNKRYLLLIVFISLISSYFLLSFALEKAKTKDFNNLALGHCTESIFESYNSNLINFWNFKIDDKTEKNLLKNKKDFIVSFGNSQSHSVNTYKKDKDHLFIYYIADKYKNYNVLNLSAPNANMQEFFLGLVNLSSEVKNRLNTIIVSCVFDDTRENGIRKEMEDLINKNSDILTKYKIGQEILKIHSKNNENNIIEKLPKDIVEDYIDEKLSYFELYERKGDIRSLFNTNIYFFRNWLFNIKPTSKRKKIQSLYDKNMIALNDIKSFCKEHNINLILYIAPIRNDIELPYIDQEYKKFKSDIFKLHDKVYNLEDIVEPKYWGLTNGDWVDFMHFKGEGHRALSEYLLDILKKDNNGI